ncbi:MAG: FliI/YscN family ATPase [Gammaproteobacteria bacterium]
MLDSENTFLKQHLTRVLGEVEKNSSVIIGGTITRVSGIKIEASGLSVPLNTTCEIILSDTKKINAEVIGFADNVTYLMATEHIDGILPGALVVPLSTTHHANVGISLLGRVLDASGKPIDGRGIIETTEKYSLVCDAINPLMRRKISEPLDVGIRAINALLTVGKGQRIGIFAASGIGKSVLLGMMTHYSKADVVVVGLVGERGREVKEFIEDILGESGLAKAVVVASPADTSPLSRVNSAVLATTIAEYYRDKGKHVLLILDSLTRFAQSQREISLSVGELPATKGFTPSVFAKLSQLVERSGNGIGSQGSITAFYTVLVEGDEQTDPVAEHIKSVLDGHIYLSKQLAGAGHYPAIDLEKSISRVMPAIVDEVQLACSMKFKNLYSAYVQNRELLNVGMYQQGADKTLDEAIRYKDQFEIFLTQKIDESCDMNESVAGLQALFMG